MWVSLRVALPAFPWVNFQGTKAGLYRLHYSVGWTRPGIVSWPGNALPIKWHTHNHLRRPSTASQDSSATPESEGDFKILFPGGKGKQTSKQKKPQEQSSPAGGCLKGLCTVNQPRAVLFSPQPDWNNTTPAEVWITPIHLNGVLTSKTCFNHLNAKLMSKHC